MRIASISMCLILSSCAMMMNGTRQQIHFKGGPEQGVTKVRTPDGTFEVENGSGTYLLTRSKSDIPVTVTCPDGKKKDGIIETQFDFLWGGVGNIFTGGIGWFIDPFSPEGFTIKDLSLVPFCKE
jgi:hypothetical protein